MAAAHTQAHCLPEGNNIINIDNSASNTCVNTSSIPNNSSTTRTSNNNNNNSTKGGPVLGAPLSPLRLRPVSTPIAIPANPVYTEAPTSSTAAYPCPQNISTLPVSDAPSTMHHSPPAINGEQVSMMAATPSYLSSPSFERLSVTSSTGAVVSMPTCTASTTTVTCSQLHPGVARCHEFQSFSAEGARRSGPRARVMRSHSATTKGQGGVGAGSLAISTAGPGGEGGRSPVAGEPGLARVWHAAYFDCGRLDAWVCTGHGCRSRDTNTSGHVTGHTYCMSLLLPRWLPWRPATHPSATTASQTRRICMHTHLLVHSTHTYDSSPMSPAPTTRPRNPLLPCPPAPRRTIPPRHPHLRAHKEPQRSRRHRPQARGGDAGIHPCPQGAGGDRWNTTCITMNSCC